MKPTISDLIDNLEEELLSRNKGSTLTIEELELDLAVVLTDVESGRVDGYKVLPLLGDEEFNGNIHRLKIKLSPVQRNEKRVTLSSKRILDEWNKVK